jgi:hypothetical protein
MIIRWDTSPFEQACIWSGFALAIVVGRYLCSVIVSAASGVV